MDCNMRPARRPQNPQSAAPGVVGWPRGEVVSLSSSKSIQPKAKAVKTPPPQASELCLEAARAADDKQARDIRVLDLRNVTSFADNFVICSGANARQTQAISDEILQRLKAHNELPNSIEGYDNADWILMDYGDYLVHIFSPAARQYYDLERLWRDARDVAWEPAAKAK